MNAETKFLALQIFFLEILLWNYNDGGLLIYMYVHSYFGWGKIWEFVFIWSAFSACESHCISQSVSISCEAVFWHQNVFKNKLRHHYYYLLSFRLESAGRSIIQKKIWPGWTGEKETWVKCKSSPFWNAIWQWLSLMYNWLRSMHLLVTYH